MFKIERIGPNRLDIQIEGKLDSVEMQLVLDELVRESEGIEDGVMLYRVGEFHMPTLGALAIEFSRIPSLISLIRKFDRAAVIAEKGWIRKLGEIEGALIPGLEIRGFELDEESVAEAWLASRP